VTYIDLNGEEKKLCFGDHLSSIYQNKEQQFAFIVPFIMEGLDNNQKCVYVMDENTEESIRLEFEKDGFKIDKYLESRQLELVKSNDTYLNGGTFKPEVMLNTIEMMEMKAVEEGYFGLRGTGEMGISIKEKIDDVELIDYESRINEFMVGRRIILICQYNENKIDYKVLNNIIRTHPLLIVYGKMYENKYFYTAPEYMDKGSDLLPAEAYKTVIDTIISE